MASLKEKNEIPLAVVTLLNAVLIYFFINGIKLDFGKLNEILSFWQTGALALLLAIATNVINHLFPRKAKDTLVYLRKFSAPGHRAFSCYSGADPRIDMSSLKNYLGVDDLSSMLPQEQNSIWYKMLKSCQSKPEVEQAHKNWLLFRDMNSLIIVFVILAIIASCVFDPLGHGVYIQVLFLIELLLVWIAARNAGVSFVQNVVAVTV